MQRVDMDTAFRRMWDIRLALAGLLVLSMTANLALTVGFAGRETVTVLVPAASGPAWEVGGIVVLLRSGGLCKPNPKPVPRWPPLWISSPPPPDSRRSLRRAAYPQLPEAARTPTPLWDTTEGACRRARQRIATRKGLAYARIGLAAGQPPETNNGETPPRAVRDGEPPQPGR